MHARVHNDLVLVTVTLNSRLSRQGCLIISSKSRQQHVKSRPTLEGSSEQ